MKWTMVTIYLCVTLNFNLQAQALKQQKYQYPKGASETLFNSIEQWAVNNFKSQSKLKEIKFNIIMGNLDFAKILLNEATLTVDFTKAVQLRYLALIHFIEGNYQLVVNTLSKPEMLDFTVQAKVCFLNVLSQLILEKIERASLTWKLCRDATSIHSKTDLAWMQIIVDLKTTKNKNYINTLFKNISIDNVEQRYLRIFLKLALYLNQQDKIIPRFKYFGKSPLENEIQRELIGLNYYRNGNLVKAYQLLENLETSNAEVFKGNLYLYQKNHEAAFAQYKLALKRKSNSRNALNRLLPLSWKLNQWDEGLQFLQRITISKENDIENYTLMAAFLSMSGKHSSAKIYLDKITEITHGGNPVEVSQIKVFNNLKLAKLDEIEGPAASSCSNNDGLNCWLIIALNSWESLTELMNEDRKVHEKLVDLSERYSSSSIKNPIIEQQLLNQKEIEELDNNLINLFPKN